MNYAQLAGSSPINYARLAGSSPMNYARLAGSRVQCTLPRGSFPGYLKRCQLKWALQLWGRCAQHAYSSDVSRRPGLHVLPLTIHTPRRITACRHLLCNTLYRSRYLFGKAVGLLTSLTTP